MTAILHDTVGGRGRSLARLNDVLAVLLVAIVVMSPIPLGSNRPQFWALGAAVAASLAAIYFIAQAASPSSRRIALSKVAGMASLFAVLCGWLVFQMLPLGGLLHTTLPTATPVPSPTVSLDPGQTWLLLLQFLGYGLFYYLLMQVAANRHRAMATLGAIFAAIAAYAVLGLLTLTLWGDTILGLQKWAYAGSATGTFVNRNSFATFLGMGFAAGLALLFASLAERDAPARRLTNIGALLAGLLLIGAALLATNSRMGVASAACGAVLVAALGARKLRLRAIGIVVAVLVVAAAAAIMLAIFGGGLLQRLLTTETGDGRAELYSQVWQAIMQRPILGYGGGSFQWAFAIVAHPPLDLDLTWDKAHSSYLQLWFELGLVFGSVPIVLLAIAGRRSLATFAKSGGSWAVGLAGVGALAVGAIHSTVDFSLEIQANAFLLLALLAIGAAVPDAPRSTPRRDYLDRRPDSAAARTAGTASNDRIAS